MIKQSDIDWSLNHHKSLRDGGTWAIPRSGLIMRKTPEGFELQEVMPWMPVMGEAAKLGMSVPVSADDLIKYQRKDFGDIQSVFEAAGLSFSDPKNLLGNTTLDDLKRTLKSGQIVSTIKKE